MKDSGSEAIRLNYEEDDFTFLERNHNKQEQTIAEKVSEQSLFSLFIKNKKIVFSGAVLLLIVLLAIFGPYMNQYQYDQQIIENQNMAPRVQGLEKLHIFDGSESVGVDSKTVTNKYKQSSGNENTYYWFGTDSLGRDIWSRTWVGTRISLYIALVAVLIDLLFGMGYGLISGYLGDRVDFILQRIIEIVSSIPTLIIVTLLLVVVDSGVKTITLALILTGWIRMSRIARAQILEQKELEYVKAAKSIGRGSLFIIFKEVLPNVWGAIITNTMFSISDAIFTEAFLSFVGLGVQTPMASLGSLISDGYNTIMIHPYQVAAPVIVLVILILCFNILADGIREVLVA